MTKIKKSNRKLLFVPLVVLLIVGALGAYYLFDNRNESIQTPVNEAPQAEINYNPPTEEDSQRVEENKQNIVTQDEKLKKQPTLAPGEKRTLKPVITYAGQYGSAVEVGGYVSVFEEGGTCSANFTRGSFIVTKNVQAIRGANSVDCPVMAASSSEFSQKGTYDVTVTYNSASVSGVSDVRQIEIK